jgi:hypothetical protein
LPDNRQGRPDIRAGNIQVGNGPEGIGTNGQHAQTGGAQLLGQNLCRHRPRAKKDEVGLDPRRINFDAGQTGQSCRQRAGVGVILSQAIAVVIEGVESAGGDNAGLAQATAELLPETARPLDKLTTARQG